MRIGDPDELQRQLNEIDDYLQQKRMEQATYDKEFEEKDKLSSIDKSIFRKAAIVAGATASGFDSSDPTSIKHAVRNGVYAFAIIVIILLMIGGIFAVGIIVPNKEIYPYITYAICIFEIIGLFAVIRLFRSMLGKPLLIKMLFSHDDLLEARYYHKKRSFLPSNVLLVLCVLVVIIILAITLLLLF